MVGESLVLRLLSWLFRSFYLLASLTFVLSQGNPNPVVGGDPDDGWHTLPEVIDATAYPDWDVGGGSLVGTWFI